MKVAGKLQRKDLLVVGALILSIILTDRLTKQLILDNFDEIIVWNTGISLGFFSNHGLGTGQVVLHIAITAILAGFFGWLIKALKEKNTYFVILPLGMVFSGGMSNLIDRVIWSKVLDFIPFFGLWTFNIADLAISVGIVTLAGYKVLYESKRKI